MRISSALKNDRLCKALTGLSVEEFNRLVIDFSWNYTESRIKSKPDRVRRYGGGIKGRVPNIEDKLFIILFYLKTYPTFDVLGFVYDLPKSKSHRWVHILLPILEQTLKRKLVLPERQITSVKEFLEKFPEVKDLMLDGVERRVKRPTNKKKQNKLYSGKKKTQTRKNIIGATPDRKIIILTKTKSGRRHDKRLADKEELARKLPPGLTAWIDTGFVGIEKQHKNTQIPKRRSKNHELTEVEKENNSIISSIRVVVEHAIAGVKRYGCLSQVYRNRIPNLDDKFMLIASGLWNYHLDFK